MKKDKKEHKKGAETTIGKIIYGFLLFMPLFAIGVTSGYAMFNKNAYKSFTDSKFIDTTTNITNFSQVYENDVVTFNYIENNNITGTTDTAKFYFKSISFNPTDYGFNDLEYDSISVSSRTNSQYIFLYVENNYYFKNIWGTSLTTFTAVASANNNGASTNATTITYKTSYIEEKIDNVFYYAVDKVTENPLFSWATNSIIYTTINATCTQLSITTPFIPLLLSYWLIISVIYFLYDIALMLIWLLHNKIHELQESF